MSAVVRRLLPEDGDAYVAIRRRALEREPAAFLSSPHDDLALSLAFVREALASPSQAIFGAFAPGLVGVVGIYRDGHRKAAHKAHVWGLYVDGPGRRSGTGRALMGAAIGFARALAGVTHVVLGVSQSAEAAIRLYESIGFVTWGIEPHALRIESRPVAERHMALALDPDGS